MQDIDFDEIDRAVNSVSATEAPAVDTSVTVSTPNPPVSDPVAVDTSTQAPPALPAARRSSGRFMDVVHPSSDMRTVSNVAERPVQPAAPAASVAATPVSAPTNEWPDPLDFHGFVDEAEPTPAEAPIAPIETETPAGRVPAPSAHDMHPPLETPFIRNAVVEKRPLGAFSEANPSPSVPEPVIPETPVEEPAATAPVEEPAPEAAAEAVPSFDTPAPTPVVEAPAGPVSITQQYKEQPSTSDQPSGAIFDTESYHQPLAHVPKKKSGALVIVWIAALILVGAGAGAAVYFFVLPLL